MDELIYLIYFQWNEGHLRAILAKSRNFPTSVDPFRLPCDVPPQGILNLFDEITRHQHSQPNVFLITSNVFDR